MNMKKLVAAGFLTATVFVACNTASVEKPQEALKPITFEKRQNIMGDWLYLWSDKDFVIPEGVSPTLPPKKKYEKENENSFHS